MTLILVIMKKFFKFACLSTIVLAGVVSLNSCSSNDEVDVNPTFDGNSVKTQFAISIPGALKTRMTAGDAQETEAFSGMTDIHLYAYPDASVTAGTEALTSAPISLAAIEPTGLSEHGNNNQFNAKVYNDVSIPVGTKTFLFYGKKTSTTDGKLTATWAAAGGTAASTRFAQVPISENTVSTVGSADQASTVLGALNAVASKINEQLEAATTADEAIVSTLTVLQTSFESNKAGSATSVKAMLTDLSATLGILTNDRITAIKTVVDAQITALASTTFPRNIYLPDGAVGVKCTSHNFAFSAENNSGLGTPELNTYVKPAELYYYVNTPIHVSNSSHQTEYASQTAWTDVLALYTNGTSVASSTRGIVLDNNIQYAVAQLQSDVQIVFTGGASKLKANDGTPATTTVDVNNNSFTVTGLLIGNQGDVDWKFQRNTAGTNTVYDPVQTVAGTKATTTASAANYTLLLETKGVPDPSSAIAASTNDEEVRVAVELENDGDDFFGFDDQLIPKGTRFYLVGSLKLSDLASPERTKVFEQDYKTIANFKIGNLSLTKAYNTIPDLRTPQMELGLAVDLHWTAGLTFTPNLGI